MTVLTLTGTPGSPRTFTAKTPAGAEKGAGLFTELGLSGAPTGLRQYDAKTPATGGGKGEGPFTSLALHGTPSGIRIYLPKTQAEVIVTRPGGATSTDGQPRYVIRLPESVHVDAIDDEDVLLLVMAVASIAHEL